MNLNHTQGRRVGWAGWLRRRWVQWQVRAVLGIAAAWARRAQAGRHVAAAMRLLARARLRARGGRSLAGSPEALGAAWQRGFPSARQVPIVAVDAHTAYGEIHTPCPLRGTGDLRACWRMMAYDRAVVRASGGHFHVLQSQAEPGVAVCRVAISVAAGAHPQLGAAEAGPEVVLEAQAVAGWEARGARG